MDELFLLFLFSFVSIPLTVMILNPNRSLGRLFNPFHFFRSVNAISAFLSASCPHLCLAVARYDFASDAANLLETNTNLS